MPGEGLSRIHLDGEKLLVVEDALGMPKAREMAEAQKLKAFGLLSSLLSRPKPEEIEISYEEKRYDAFWRVLGTARFEYTRRKVYRVAVEKMVQEIDVLGTAFRVPPQGGSFEIEGVERCVEDYREETIVNAQNGQPDPSFSKYLGYLSQQIASTEALTQDGTPVVALEAKPAFLVRQVVNALIKPIHADHILDEQIGISELALYFVPVYTFELYWKTKDKRVAISFDGATGELRPHASRISERLRKSFTNDEIFEFGKEVANFVPGGGLALMVGKKAVELYEG
jgi:hypothetical protein